MKQMAESDKVSFKTLSKIPKVEPPADLTRLPATLEPVAGCQKLNCVKAIQILTQIKDFIVKAI